MPTYQYIWNPHHSYAYNQYWDRHRKYLKNLRKRFRGDGTLYGGPSKKYLDERNNKYFTRISNVKSIYAQDTKRLTELDKRRELCGRYTKNGRMYGWRKIPEYDRFDEIQKFYEKLRKNYYKKIADLRMKNESQRLRHDNMLWLQHYTWFPQKQDPLFKKYNTGQEQRKGKHSLFLSEHDINKITDNWKRVKRLYNPWLDNRQTKEEQEKLNEQREEGFDLRINIKDPYIAERHSKTRNSPQMFTRYKGGTLNRSNNNEAEINGNDSKSESIEYDVI